MKPNNYLSGAIFGGDSSRKNHNLAPTFTDSSEIDESFVLIKLVCTTE